MKLTEDQVDLVASARARQPGAFRELAVVLDEQLAEEDAFFDGAVAAWRVVRAPRPRLVDLWARAWRGARRRGDLRAWSADVRANDGDRHPDQAVERRPAA